MNVTLIGMPGSGKSFIGSMLADRLGYRLVELDVVLEREYGVPLMEAIERFGERDFLERQARAAIAQATGDGIVVSPGGSIVLSDDAMRHLNEVSKVVYLKIGLEAIRERVGKAPRAIVGSKGKHLDQVYAERAPLYEQWASAVIDADQEAEKAVADIESIL